jgi:ubiquinone biosynthesis protein COQ9
MPERSSDRDGAVRDMLPHVADHGWRRAAVVAAGYDRLEAELLFPGGTADLLEAWCDLADRDMEDAAIAHGVADQRLSQRVRTLIALRLANARPNKEAVRRAIGLFALPGYAPLAARCVARSVDAIWHAAGDASADFSWYTKRGILVAVWTSTLLFWLTDHSEDDAATLAFLDRRLAGVAQIGKLRGRVAGALGRLRTAAS